MTESRKHPAQELLRQIPRLGPIRVALVIALLQTPHRFRTKRQLWAYCGLALQTRSSGEYRFTGGQLQHSQKLPADFELVGVRTCLKGDVDRDGSRCTSI
jgi:Transposase IS116/IS110/IS902 family